MLLGGIADFSYSSHHKHSYCSFIYTCSTIKKPGDKLPLNSVFHYQWLIHLINIYYNKNIIVTTFETNRAASDSIDLNIVCHLNCIEQTWYWPRDR